MRFVSAVLATWWVTHLLANEDSRVALIALSRPRVGHGKLAGWRVTLVTASGMTLTAPPAGPTVAHPRGDAGTHHENIATRRLTDGL